MKIGVTIFGLQPADILPVARKADELGYDLLLVAEHLATPVNIPSTYPYSDSGEPPFTNATPWFDPIGVLTFMAAATKRIRLGTSIYILPLRHPISIARAVTTLDVLSNGRTLLGVGVGWMRDEFEAVDQGFDNRGKRTLEIVEILKRLWTQETIEFKGEHYSFQPVTFYPKTVQKPHPPIHFGGETQLVLRRSARIGDGWLGMQHTPESAKERVGELNELRRGYGREKEPFEITVGTSVPPTVDNLRKFEEAGVHGVRTAVWERGAPLPDMLAGLERFADQVMSKV